jgi:hypothetical protein
LFKKTRRSISFGFMAGYTSRGRASMPNPPSQQRGVK